MPDECFACIRFVNNDRLKTDGNQMKDVVEKLSKAEFSNRILESSISLLVENLNCFKLSGKEESCS